MGRGRWWGFVLVVAVAVAVVASTASQSKQDHLVSRIAFGSCSDQSDPQVLLLFLFLFISSPSTFLSTLNPIIIMANIILFHHTGLFLIMYYY